MPDALDVTATNELLVITINRPERRNAINLAMAQCMADAFERLDSDPDLRVGILTGAGGTFCAGMDLKAFVDGKRPEIPGRGFAGLTEAPPDKPLIAAVEGFALGGGCEIVLACDLVVAARDAVFGLPEVTRGLVAGSGGLLRLPRRIPAQIAMELVLTGDRFDAEQAHGWGLVNHVVAPGDALAAARQLATRIAANAPLAVQASKHIVRDLAAGTQRDAWAEQLALVESVMASQDAMEGAQAFADKREPSWRGV